MKGIKKSKISAAPSAIVSHRLDRGDEWDEWVCEGSVDKEKRDESAMWWTHEKINKKNVKDRR